jgi:geranylgeranylglycerol-phosphate geranylgeranyltransferase
MIKLFPFLIIIRPINAVLTAFAVVIGFWLSNADSRSLLHLGLLIISALCALSFGNVINDIVDFEGDLINHPNRPLPSGQMTKQQAFFFCWILAVLSFLSSFFVSIAHSIGTLIPIVLLTVYSLFLKGTPLLGNVLVSLLVSYPIIFGGMGSPRFYILLIPATYAFLLNISREIVKDMEDKKGDLETGLKTTAILQEKILLILIMIIGIVYIPLLLIPFFIGHFHKAYLYISLFVLIPLHIYWFLIFYFKKSDSYIKKTSRIIKFEMLCGLLALVIDKLLSDI